MTRLSTIPTLRTLPLPTEAIFPLCTYSHNCRARLVEHAIRNGWRLIQKALRLLPFDTIMPEYSKQCTSHPRPAIVVYFVGGVTYGEVATLRLLGKFLSKIIRYFRKRNHCGDDRNDKRRFDDQTTDLMIVIPYLYSFYYIFYFNCVSKS